MSDVTKIGCYPQSNILIPMNFQIINESMKYAIFLLKLPFPLKHFLNLFSFMPLYAALKRFTMFLLASCFGIKSNLPQGKVYALKNYHLILVLYIELEGFY